MATFNAPPTGTSILAYAPFFPNGQVNDAWNTWFTSLYNTILTGPVLSFNARTGIVLPASGDYTASQITGLAAFIAANGVASFNGRIGTVLPAANDYTFAQLASKPTTIAGYGITDTLTNTFNARSGTVVPATGDYSVAQVTGAAPLASPTFTGTATIPFTQIGTGAIASTVDAWMKNRFISVKDFGAKGDNATNDTAAIQAAITAVYSAGGGTVYFPPGNYKVTTLALSFASTTTVNLVGSGKESTQIVKIDASTSPIINWSSTGAIVSSYSNISDMAIVGNANGSDGIDFTQIARFKIQNLDIKSCAVGIWSKGGLVFDAENCTIQQNQTGVKFDRNAGATPYSNLIHFNSCQIIGNTTYGVDLIYGNTITFTSCDFESNGTTANTSTGGAIIRATFGTEIGYSSAAFNSCWFEVNKGWTFSIEAASSVLISFKDSLLTSPESNRAINALGYTQFQFLNSMVPSPADIVNIAGATTHLANALFGVLNDTSTRSVYSGIVYSGIAYNFIVKGGNWTVDSNGNVVTFGTLTVGGASNLIIGKNATNGVTAQILKGGGSAWDFDLKNSAGSDVMLVPTNTNSLVLGSFLGIISLGSAVASAATITPSGPLFHVTGIATVTTINLPFAGFIGSITIIPDGLFSTGTAGNIALASVAAVSKALVMTYDGTKWYPSY